MNDLFQSGTKAGSDYTAKDIEVLEGLEPVRRRPGMYIGGTDERALHHLFAEVLDNSMDEAVAGHADRIEVEFQADGSLRVMDNGRGIPIDRHPKFKDKSALEVILTTLHSGGKFSSKVYSTAGGLHGVGISVVNALSDRLVVEVARDRELWRQHYSRGTPQSKLEKVGATPNRRGTTVVFHPDEQIFGKGAHFRAARLFKMARSKAYLYPGVKIHWSCAAELIPAGDETPTEAVLHFPGGLQDYLSAQLEGQSTVTPVPFAGRAQLGGERGQVEWAIHWPQEIDEGWLNSYCNTVTTPEGGTHEAGFRTALLRGFKDYAELTNTKKASQITADDIVGGGAAMLSVFIKDPQFQGQTKDRLVTVEAQKLVEQAIKDHFDHWLAGAPQQANTLLAHIIERAEDRLRRRAEKDVSRKSATRKLRLPGKLADCADEAANGSEIFIVEGDSAGGSAKQARDRRIQAVLPLRGKILNVASAGSGKLAANQELSDLVQALGCGLGSKYRAEDLRYDKVIIMTDADVDGAHIASLLMTFFFREMPKLIEHGHLYLAQPPLYRISAGGKTAYAMDDADKDSLIATEFKGRKVEISRFKGLGEMPPAQLKETTMSPKNRTLLRVQVPVDEVREADDLVERLMGRKAELRFQFIQERAAFATDIDV
ncbi:DNA topoisomerase IV subunit B [Ferrovibrio xuzhouensis]|uniref:DNA topoisomerase 4 subunit B n=1 Tax=Ferrovibrio xuzhouensis TaxID=1576914 RepID=A0ABV7VKX9_9PROT